VRQILEIARHELEVALRTRRAVIALAIYVVLATLGQLGYVVFLNALEEQARAMLDKGDPAQTEKLLDLVGQDAYKRALAWFAGIKPEDMASYLHESVILPVLLWGSLAFLPFVIVLTSFDQMSADLESRSLCYAILRAPRRAILLGKLVAHTALMTVLLLITGLLLLLSGAALLDSLDLAPALLGFFTLLLLLVPYGLCYLGITAFASANVAQPFTALVSAFAITVVLRVIGWTEVIPPEHQLAPLRHLAILSPAHHHSGLWLAGAGPLASVAFYLGVGAIFTLLALWRLEGRDL
jgi:ABC-type transport system involved in multi-copper enzyme maturation permease subunit